MTLRVLSANDVRRALPMKDAIQAMRAAFRSLAEDRVRMPPRVPVALRGAKDLGLVMPAYDEGSDVFGVKIITVHPENATKGLPMIQGVVVAIDGSTGRPWGLLDAAAVTGIRTAAVSALATDLLARDRASSLALLGTGVQAKNHLEALRLVRPIDDVRVYSPNAKHREKFAKDEGVTAAPTSTRAVSGAHIVCCATTSSTSVFRDADVGPGTHILAVGTFRPDAYEVPPVTVARARRIVDQGEAAMEEAGDIVVPFRQGLLASMPFHATLGEVLVGRKPGRTGPDEVTLFKSVGLAVEDAAAAHAALERADRDDIGRVVDL